MIASSENITADDWVWLGLTYPKGEDNTKWIDESNMTFNLSSKYDFTVFNSVCIEMPFKY